LLARPLAPGARATVLIADHSEYGFASALPAWVVVAVRVVRGPGPWRLTFGRGAAPARVPVRRIDAHGPAGGWTQVLALLAAEGDTARGPLLVCDAAETADAPWLLVEPTPGDGPRPAGGER
ncbi:hypothetical protein MHW47_10110, partial [Streptomyces sp. OfavH-34-F]|uniref:hypothetical protein n=1 Tax=Streptomyces sp. OfavH-34-F TaxID=2917760 RepID=UPI001EF1C3F3